MCDTLLQSIVVDEKEQANALSRLGFRVQGLWFMV